MGIKVPNFWSNKLPKTMASHYQIGEDQMIIVKDVSSCAKREWINFTEDEDI